MKSFYATCYCFLIFCVTSAQSDTGISSPLNFIPGSQLKATIHLKNNSETGGIITQITDSTVVLSQSFQNENSITYISNTIAIAEIKIIKIKRHAFFLGMGCGAVVTGLVGYAAGYISYTDKPELDETENKNNANTQGYGAAAIAAVPGAVIGSLVGSVFIKRKFRINGDIKNIKGMIKTLWGLNEHK